MKHLAALLLLSVAISGCLSPNERQGDPPSTAAGAVSSRDLGEALARYVTGPNCADTDEFWKTAKQAAIDTGVPVTVLDSLGTVESNRDFDDALRADFAARCRKL